MKKMTKWMTLLMIVMTVFSLSACSKGSKKDITIDTAALAKQLNDETINTDQLSQTASGMLGTIYFVTDDILAGGDAYMSSGATACEVAVIECKSEDQTADVKKLFENRVSNQSNLYASYNAGEVDKLKKAIIKTAGKYAVLVVADDTQKAENILKDAGF